MKLIFPLLLLMVLLKPWAGVAQTVAPAHPDAVDKGPDRTHLNPTGAAVFGRMVADNLAKVWVELGPDIKRERAAGVFTPGR